MHRITIAILVAACLPLAAQSQKQAAAKDVPPASANAVERAEPIPRNLSDVGITRDASGGLKCLHADGHPCSETEVQAVTAITNSRSNIKNNLAVVSPDGRIKCVAAATGKPCSDADVQAITTKWNIKSNKTGAVNSSAPPESIGKGPAAAPHAETKK
jgi:hypothetical protein